MKKTIHIIAIAALWLFLSGVGYGQTAALKIGDKVPDITISNIINYKTSSAKLSDFKGKLLILDFWATWCAPCISMMPRMDSLQRVFGKELSFVSVTYQKKVEVEAFMTRLHKRQGKFIDLPLVVSDQILHNIFPHTTLPHYVWVDESGIVIAITGQEEINDKNIRKHLQGKKFNALVKNETRISHDVDKPFLVGNNGGDGSNLLYHSAITSYTEGLQGTWAIVKPDSIRGRKITLTNLPLVWFYRIAYGGDDQHLVKNRVIFETKDTNKLTSRLSGPAYGKWMKEGNGYCYELLVPKSLNNNIFRIMQDDLSRLFSQYQASVQQRLVKCLVLTRTSPMDKLSSAGGTPSAIYDATGCKLVNQDLEKFVARLSRLYLQNNPMPLIDESGYTGKIDLVINASLSNVNALNGELTKYDLKIQESERAIDMLVISDTH